MTEIKTNWTRPEFKAYLMLYAASANFFESKDETDLVHKIVSDADYKMIHRELEKDNDYQSIQKILYNIEKFNYSKGQLHELMADIKTLFYADGEFDIQEENMLRALKKLIN
ncbi:MAG: hypothetical protein ACJAUD_000925 [Crocinitomicaceae bacterium]|jgi:hypothetical protein